MQTCGRLDKKVYAVDYIYNKFEYMRSNTRRYISSRTNRRVGRVSRVIISPSVLQENINTAKEVSPVIENIYSTIQEDTTPVIENTYETLQEDIQPVIENTYSTVQEEEAPVVDEPETTVVVDEEPVKETPAEVKEEKTDEPDKKESAYAKRKKAKLENKK